MSYVAERRLEEKEQRRNEIVDAAEACYIADGWDRITMDQIARKARLSRALLYVYFKDKDDLHFAIAERALQELKRRFQAAMLEHKLGLDQVGSIGASYIQFARDVPHYFLACSRFEAHRPEQVDPSSNESACFLAGDGVHSLVAEVIARGKGDGSIGDDIGDPLLTSIVLWGFIHGVIQLGQTKAHLMARDGLDAESLARQALNLARRALSARTS